MRMLYVTVSIHLDTQLIHLLLNPIDCFEKRPPNSIMHRSYSYQALGLQNPIYPFASFLEIQKFPEQVLYY